METTKINTKVVTLEDIVFENRNKAYGAYFLNNSNSKYLVIAFLIALIFVSSTVIVPFIRAIRTIPLVIIPTISIPFTSIPIESVDIIKPPVPQVLPDLPPPPSIVNLNPLLTPVIVDEPTPDDPLPPANSSIPLVNKPVQVEYTDTANKYNDFQDKPEDPIVFAPTEKAAFLDGDENTFHAWVQGSLVYPQEAIENGIGGRLFVEFCINKKGEIVDIKILNNVNPFLEKEVLRVLNSAPKWKPAKQGGYAVKQQFHMALTFKLNS